MKTIHTYIALAFMAVLASCTHGMDEMKLTDHSFAFTPELSYDKEHTRNVLSLRLTKGEGRQFKGTFSIDDGEELDLYGSDGKPFEQGGAFTLDDNGRVTFTVKGLSMGVHTLQMTITSGIYTQRSQHPLTVEREPFRFSPTVVTDASEKSVLMLTLSEGYAKMKYSGSVLLDSETSLTGEEPIEMDFSRNDTWSMALPYLLPGEHSLRISVTDGQQEESTDYSFEEPMKFETLKIRLYSDLDGRYHLDIPFNPYNIKVRSISQLDIRAECTYCYDAPKVKTVAKVINDKKNLEMCKEQTDTVMTYRDSLIHAVREMYELSETYRVQHIGGREPGIDYIITGSKKAFYKVQSESFSIEMECDTLPGMTVLIENSIGQMLFNGQERELGEFIPKRKEDER